MIDFILSNHKLYFISVPVFICLFLVRYHFIKKKRIVFSFYFCLILYFLFLTIGGSGVQNDGYKRLNEFRLLEETNQIEYAKKNLQKYGSMLQIDLMQFKDSAEFNDYLKKQDENLDSQFYVWVGWFSVFVTDILFMLVTFFYKIFFRKRLR